MYQTQVYEIKESHKLYNYCKTNCQKAKKFKNTVIFHLRQMMFSSWKGFKNLDARQIETIIRFSQTNDKFKPVGENNCLPSYEQLDYMFRKNKDPDYFNGLPIQSVQQMEKKVLESFRLWFAAVREYKRHPSKFSGRPRLPKYVKGDEVSFAITNQDAVVYGKELKLPKTKERLCLWDAAGRLKQVEIIPYYGIYKICVVYETEGFTDSGICKDRDVLREYLERKEQEVLDMLMELYDQEEVIKSYVESEKYDTAKETAKRMLEDGTLPIDKVAKFANLPI